MFGNVLINPHVLSAEDKSTYNQFYCGICRALGEANGGLSRLTLNYDMTFLALFLSSLYEPQQKQINKKCLIHPKKSQSYIKNEFIEYAADMNIVLAYYKSIDDWHDDKNILMFSFSSLIKSRIKLLKEKYPDKISKIESLISDLSAIENRNGTPDESSDCFGKILGEIFRCKSDNWENDVYNFGYSLGKFIYLIDAAADIEKDQKKRNYNPFLTLDISESEIENILKVLIGEAAEIFEKLPLVQNENILRNTIYSGVWQKYNSAKAKKERKAINGNRSL
ncbi:MAG: hypothetical protein IKA17_08685 [Clostridia bacterium]|nr:hypothetical protein [Clostridia bacterium]